MLTKYKWVLNIILVAALIGAARWIVSPRIELRSQRAERAGKDLAKEQELTAMQALVLEGQQREIDCGPDIDRGIKLLEQTITQQGRQQSRAVEELKRHDETIAEYLRTAVPDALGVLYARPDTTDPAAYRANSDVRPGAVLPAGRGPLKENEDWRLALDDVEGALESCALQVRGCVEKERAAP